MERTITTTFELNNGYKMPKIGLGTFQIDNEDVIYNAVVEAGYRHINTAHYYGNEDIIGKALKRVFEDTEIKREHMFITTKLWGDQKEDVEGALRQSLDKLQLDYVDLYLNHFPVAFKMDEEGNYVHLKIPNHKTWADMEALVNKGWTKSIGVSNFTVQSLLDMMAYAEIMPVANEIEIHPYLAQESVVKFCHKYKIVPVGFCPLARTGNTDLHGPEGIYDNPVIKEIAAKYDKPVSQIWLAWACARGYSVIPKSSNVERLKQNMDSQNILLSEEDVAKILALDQNYRICYGERLPFVFGDDIYS